MKPCRKYKSRTSPNYVFKKPTNPKCSVFAKLPMSKDPYFSCKTTDLSTKKSRNELEAAQKVYKCGESIVSILLITSKCAAPIFLSLAFRTEMSSCIKQLNHAGVLGLTLRLPLDMRIIHALRKILLIQVCHLLFRKLHIRFSFDPRRKLRQRKPNDLL